MEEEKQDDLSIQKLQKDLLKLPEPEVKNLDDSIVIDNVSEINIEVTAT